jgi:integrase
MASIRRRPERSKNDPRYDVRYRLNDGSVRTRTFRTRKAAERFANTVETDKVRGALVDPRAGKVALSEYAIRWIETRPNIRPRTRETYETQLRLHVLPVLGSVELVSLTPRSVREWHAQLSGSNLGPNTVAKCYRLLRTILGTAVADELIVRNPCRIERAGVERSDERPIATVDQVWELAEVVEPRYRCLVLVAGFVGLRLGELLGLQRRHVNLLHAQLVVERQEQQLRGGGLLVGPPKTDAGRRKLTLPPFLVAELERHLAEYSVPGPDGRVFPGEKGGPLRKQVWHPKWRAACRVVGLPETFRFHDLRHTANTLTAAAGASTRELMQRMGHASSAAALRYQHATQDRDALLAAALGDLVTVAQRNAVVAPEAFETAG